MLCGLFIAKKDNIPWGWDVVQKRGGFVKKPTLIVHYDFEKGNIFFYKILSYFSIFLCNNDNTHLYALQVFPIYTIIVRILQSEGKDLPPSPFRNKSLRNEVLK